jgi:hypothetical protein
MKVDPDLKALLKATKKASMPLSESVERRIQKLHQLVTDHDDRHGDVSSEKAA